MDSEDTLLKQAREHARLEGHWHVVGKGQPPAKRKGTKYVEELARLQLELLKLQESVRLEGKRKLSQNREARDVDGAVRALQERGQEALSSAMSGARR